jgi:hypothetical protein
LWRTVVPSCSIDAAVCCSALACCSVRVDRSLLPCAISLEAVATLSELERTLATTSARLRRISLTAASRRAASSRPSTVISNSRSPAATREVACSAMRSGRVMLTVIRQASSAEAIITTTAATSAAHSVRRTLASARSAAAAACCCWIVMKLASSAVAWFSNGSMRLVMTAPACSVLKVAARSTASLNSLSIALSIAASLASGAPSSAPSSLASSRCLAAR